MTGHPNDYPTLQTTDSTMLIYDFSLFKSCLFYFSASKN
jgi:hypothetical protein